MKDVCSGIGYLKTVAVRELVLKFIMQTSYVHVPPRERVEIESERLECCPAVGLWRNRRSVGAWQTHVRIAPYIAPRQREREGRIPS